MTTGHTTLKVSKTLTDKLKELGGKGETYEDVIWRLIEAKDGSKKPESEPKEPIELTPQQTQS